MMNINKLLLAARHPAAIHLPMEGELPSLGGATAWLNSPPLTAADLRGKVVLIDFWTYTCINWLRTLPYVRAWAENPRVFKREWRTERPSQDSKKGQDYDTTR